MRNPVKLINQKNDLKKSHLLRLEIGLILSLLILITITKINIRSSGYGDIVVAESNEEIIMEEVIQTKQEIITPPPPRPVVPISVPNDEVIENEIIELDAELYFDTEALELPPAPPKYEEEDDEQEIFVVVEQMPELIGGLGSVQKLIEYPKMAVMAGIEGRVVVQFVIDEDGNVNDPVVVRGIGGGCDEEAVKAVQQAKFIPGRQRGKPVLVRYSLPISFSLNKSTNS